MESKFTRSFFSIIFFCVFFTGYSLTYTVSNTTDAGAGSFRQAVIDANTNPGTDVIVFAVGAGAQTITLLSLVQVTTSINIDGTTQPGFSGTPLINIGGVSVFMINAVNTGTLQSMSFSTNITSSAVRLVNSSNWLFTNNIMTGMNFGIEIQGNNTTHTLTLNNCSACNYGIYMNGGTNTSHLINNNNLSSCPQ